jgi:hypothetical protein
MSTREHEDIKPWSREAAEVSRLADVYVYGVGMGVLRMEGIEEGRYRGWKVSMECIDDERYR